MKLTSELKQILAMAVVVLIGVAAFWLTRDFRVAESEQPAVLDPEIIAVKEYVAKHFADPDAEVTEVSGPVVWHKERWRLATVRAVNAQGGRVIDSYTVRFKDGAVDMMKTMKELVRDWGALDPKDETLNLMGFAKALDEVERIDVRRERKPAE